MTDLSGLSEDLQSLQKQRAWYIKSRNMMMNRLQATVAGMNGYSNSLSKKDREKMFVEAGKLIKQISKGEAEPHPLILTGLMATDAFDEQKKATEKEMLKTAKQLPIAEWVDQPEQRGFGLLFLAIVIGETGNLENYANPGKVWRRLGCAPFTKNGVTQMGSSWRMGMNKDDHGEKMHASDWEEFGYSP